MNFTVPSMSCDRAGGDGGGVLLRRAEEFRERLVPHLRAWERHGIHFSVSPWNSVAWGGLLYGDRAEFGAGVLGEYARCFTTGWFDCRLPGGEATLQLEGWMPPEFGCIVAVTHDVMTYRFPYGHPDPAKRGERNPAFLDPALMEAAMDPLVRVFGPHLRSIVLRCSGIYPTEGYAFGMFLRRLDGFLERLGRRYSVGIEIGNSGYLRPEYFTCLRSHGVAHVLRHSDTMPPLSEQVLRPDVLTAGCALVRIDAEADEVPGRCGGARMAAEVRGGIPQVVRRCIGEKKALYVDLSDRPAGSAPLSLLAMMAMLDPDLATLSPLRRRAA